MTARLWQRTRQLIGDAVAAGAVGALVSGVPSTGHALVTGRDPLEASLAAGSILLGDEERRGRLLGAAVVVHVGVSLVWALLMAAALPRRRPLLAGAAAGAGMAALDFGLIARRFPRIRQLPVLAQVADHIVFGAVVGAVLARRRPAEGQGGEPHASADMGPSSPRFETAVTAKQRGPSPVPMVGHGQ